MSAIVSPIREHIVSGLFGLSVTVALFSVGVCTLFQEKRDNFPHFVALLISSVVLGVIIAFALAFHPFLQSKLRVETLPKLVRWLIAASVLLPVEAFLESSFVYRGAWFLTVPTQFVVGGLLGISLAILKRGWGWMVWGVCATSSGILWVVGILFAK